MNQYFWSKNIKNDKNVTLPNHPEQLASTGSGYQFSENGKKLMKMIWQKQNDFSLITNL